MAQVALGAVGGVAGFLVGGPAGAAIGFSLGMAVGAPEIPGPTIGEIARQTAKEGDPRLIVWGIVRPVGPNLIAVQEPPAIHKVKQGGKGGSAPRAEVPFRTYALGVCEGPITGYRRIWRNNKLVYDGRPGSTWGARNSPVFLRGATLYYGDYSQLPDPDLEAVFGVGEVPAHRGTAYIVLKNEDLQDTGGAVPQWLFEVERGYGTAITSKPYPIIAVEEAEHKSGSVGYPPQSLISEDLEHSSGLVVAGHFVAYTPVDYEVDPELLEHVGGSVVAGEFVRTFYVDIDNQDPEELEHKSGSVIAGAFSYVLIEYDNWPAEELEHTGGSVIGGIHES